MLINLILLMILMSPMLFIIAIIGVIVWACVYGIKHANKNPDYNLDPSVSQFAPKTVWSFNLTYNVCGSWTGIVERQGLDIITLKEDSQHKRYVEWVGEAQNHKSPIKNILTAWENYQISLPQVQEMVAQYS